MYLYHHGRQIRPRFDRVFSQTYDNIEICIPGTHPRKTRKTLLVTCPSGFIGSALGENRHTNFEKGYRDAPSRIKLKELEQVEL
jgi:hypothetical protein